MFCVYLTCYRGNKLPPFYIGSTSIIKINAGYKGSVVSKKYSSIWKQEITANPHLFNTYIISTHTTRRDALAKELTLQKLLNVVKSPMYINMSIAAIDGFFGQDVSGENNPNFGKTHSEEARSKMRKPKTLSDAQRLRKSESRRKMTLDYYSNPENIEKSRTKMAGKNNPQYGKFGEDHPHFGQKLTQESKNKISKALVGKKKSTIHIKRNSGAYKIQREATLEVFIGYGLAEVSKKLGLGASSFLYTLTSNKFRNGYRLIENLGAATDDMEPLASFIL